jgi:hypothetical protein
MDGKTADNDFGPPITGDLPLYKTPVLDLQSLLVLRKGTALDQEQFVHHVGIEI